MGKENGPRFSGGHFVYRALVLVVVIAVRGVAVPVVDVIHVVLVSNCFVAAVRAVNVVGVVVGLVLGAGHTSDPTSDMRI